jgi:hypothetical protein
VIKYRDQFDKIKRRKNTYIKSIRERNMNHLSKKPNKNNQNSPRRNLNGLEDKNNSRKTAQSVLKEPNKNPTTPIDPK